MARYIIRLILNSSKNILKYLESKTIYLPCNAVYLHLYMYPKMIEFSRREGNVQSMPHVHHTLRPNEGASRGAACLACLLHCYEGHLASWGVPVPLVTVPSTLCPSLQPFALYFNPLPYTSTLCPLLQPFALYFNPLPFTSTLCPLLQPFALYFNPLPYTSTLYPILQPFALYFNPLPFITTLGV